MATRVTPKSARVGLAARLAAIATGVVSSRTEWNRRVALNRLGAKGAHISSTEMALFELLKTAKHPQFKDIARLVK